MNRTSLAKLSRSTLCDKINGHDSPHSCHVNEERPNEVALVIDGEVQIRRLLKISLEANGYRVIEAANGEFGLVQAAQRRPDVVILELGLPDMDGVSVLKRLREWSSVPVVVLSVRDREEDKVAALDYGADDYLTKPFGNGELLARLRVAQRHSQPAPDTPAFQCGHLEVDLVARVVRVKGKPVKLTGTEYALLRLFVRHAGKVLTHRQILKEVWGPTCQEHTHYLRVHVAHLREKIEEKASQPELLITEPGIGYRLTNNCNAIHGANRDYEANSNTCFEHDDLIAR
jgi:two-component system KDP operon response regulator KdpE